MTGPAAPPPVPAAPPTVVVGEADGAQVRMAYSEAGDRHAATRLVLLHGLFDNRATWHGLMAQLAAAGCHVVAPDLIGFGDSSRPLLEHLPEAQRYTVDLQVGYLRAFLRTLGLDDVILVGSSLGGGVALRALCTEWPAPVSTVRGLVLAAATGHAQPLPPYVQLLASPAGRALQWPWVHRLVLATGIARVLARQTFRLAFHDRGKISRALVERAVAVLRAPHTLYAYRQSARNVIPADIATFPDRYRDIDVPTLILWGRDDRIVPPLFALLFEAEIPDSDLHVFDDCGHAPHLEYPDETAVLLRDWLRRHHLL